MNPKMLLRGFGSGLVLSCTIWTVVYTGLHWTGSLDRMGQLWFTDIATLVLSFGISLSRHWGKKTS